VPGEVIVLEIISPFIRWRVGCVVPMEITFIDNGGNIFVFYEFKDYMKISIV
jgi:hypothetical protein